MDLIEDMFNNREKELIYNISLGVSMERDGWYWLGEMVGDCTVKSAYKHLQVEN